MKKILWTTIFWLIVFVGFTFYMKMFNANMATGVSTWLATPTVTSTGDVVAMTGAQGDVMSGITAIQTTLTDMQTKLDTLVGANTIPTVNPAPTQAETPIIQTTTGSTTN